MKNKITKLQEEIIGLKQLNEQLKCELSKKEDFIINNYPTINSFEVKQGWHGGGTSTYRVIIDVFAGDLKKLVNYFTHRSLRDNKWHMIHSELKEQIKEEVKKELHNGDSL